ncbi:hypothetical protein [Sediminibacterium sp. TEGAF015]|uniref:hypothetical protein n=1 Tax=Sediminibacterium sp. TEGAF015 TaxID=575378 RepID=UPI002200EAD7|nr:hypothetical protein [Sediminibacterium sp. TEGAF015]BDQ11156.1 hypothetical protein TEGAF0_03730 [Sediminibacterium sp. TEGAF015]
MNPKRLLTLGLLSLVVVALLGVIMRYKIGFSLPIVNQKHLQLAHSGFAFSGLITHFILTFILIKIYDSLQVTQVKWLIRTIYVNLFFSYLACLGFIWQGFSFFAVTAQMISFLAVLVFVVLGIFTWAKKEGPAMQWFKMGGFLFLLSMLAHLWLIEMWITGNKTQFTYLAATYWFLHFQYNGWFFFVCMGLLMSWMHKQDLSFHNHGLVFKAFAFSVIPAYGLSVLWLHLPVWLYVLIVLSALIQCIGLIYLVRQFFSASLKKVLIQKPLLFFVGSLSILALVVKIALQAGSTIPSISKLAFGFRPIVIAYLHLVLLAFTLLFLLAYLIDQPYFLLNRKTVIALKFFAVMVFMNEFFLGIQGIASLSYTVVPYINEMLFGVALLLFLSALAFIRFSYTRNTVSL